MNRIYMDNAATTKMSDLAVETLDRYCRENYGNPSSIHKVGSEAKHALDYARKIFAKYLNCRPNEIIFTSGGSESDNQAILTAMKNGEKSGKKHIVSTEFEHHAILHSLDRAKEHGFDITLVKPNSDGIVSPEDIEKAITDKTCLVSVMYANNEIGTIQRIKEIGEICRKHGVLFHTDAVQAGGHIRINVRDENIDMLSLSAHKFHGAKGVGILYIKGGLKPYSVIVGGPQESGHRGGTENVPSIVASAVAFEECNNKMDIFNTETALARNSLQNRLLEIPDAIVNGQKSTRLPGTLNISFANADGESLVRMLSEKGICASTGSACTSGDIKASHVLRSIGVPDEYIHGTIRFSIEKATDEEIEFVTESVREFVERLRSVRFKG